MALVLSLACNATVALRHDTSRNNTSVAAPLKCCPLQRFPSSASERRCIGSSSGRRYRIVISNSSAGNSKQRRAVTATRSLFVAKQVITETSGSNLGVVTELWVDPETLRVVVLDVRAGVLASGADAILLKSLQKVGDVLLVEDENALEDYVNLIGLCSLVGSEVSTEDGTYLGKVRDYEFRISDGQVYSVVVDPLGAPLVPAALVSTFSLAVDDIAWVGSERIMAVEGAETRLRQLSKGLVEKMALWDPPWKEFADILNVPSPPQRPPPARNSANEDNTSQSEWRQGAGQPPAWQYQDMPWRAQQSSIPRPGGGSAVQSDYRGARSAPPARPMRRGGPPPQNADPYNREGQTGAGKMPLLGPPGLSRRFGDRLEAREGASGELWRADVAGAASDLASSGLASYVEDARSAPVDWRDARYVERERDSTPRRLQQMRYLDDPAGPGPPRLGQGGGRVVVESAELSGGGGTDGGGIGGGEYGRRRDERMEYRKYREASRLGESMVPYERRSLGERFEVDRVRRRQAGHGGPRKEDSVNNGSTWRGDMDPGRNAQSPFDFDSPE